MVRAPASLRLDAGQIVQRGSLVIAGITIPVEVHLKQIFDVFCIYSADAGIVAKATCIGVHQAVQLWHTAQLLGIDLLHIAVILRDAVLHSSAAFHRDAILIPDIIHQVMVVVPAKVLIHPDEFIAGHLSQKTAVPVVAVDVRKPVAVGAQLPEAVFLQIFQILCREKFRILFRKLIGIAQDRSLEVVFFQDLAGKQRRIPAAILKHEEQRLIRQSGSVPIIVQDVLLADRNIA